DLIERFALVDRQDVDDVRIGLNENLRNVALDDFAFDLSQYFVSDGDLALDEALAFAMAARFAKRAHDGIARTLAGHFDQAKLGDLDDRRPRAVALQGFFERAVHALLVLVLFHVDQVENDDSAAIAKPQLIRDFLNRFEVRLQNRVFEV